MGFLTLFFFSLFGMVAGDKIVHGDPELLFNDTALQIKCPLGDNVWSVARAVLIEAPGLNDAELALTVAHGFAHPDTDLEGCVVYDGKGQRLLVKAVSSGPYTQEGFNADWAFMILDGRFENTERFPLHLTPSRPDHELQAWNVTSDHNSLSCEIEPEPSLQHGFRVFGHSCPGWPGQSGSPMLVRTEDGQHALVGINIAYFYQNDSDGQIERVGLVLMLDDELLHVAKRLVDAHLSEG